MRLLSNFVGFFRNLLNSPSAEAAVMARLAARDIRTSLGKNLARIRDLTHLDPWSVSKDLLQHRLSRGFTRLSLQKTIANAGMALETSSSGETFGRQEQGSFHGGHGGRGEIFCPHPLSSSTRHGPLNDHSSSTSVFFSFFLLCPEIFTHI